MKKAFLLAALITVVVSVNIAYADKAKVNIPEWGNSGAKPVPMADSKGRAGCWWLPKDTASNKDDAEVWGNRGIVYGDWKKSKPKTVEEKRPLIPGPPSQHEPHDLGFTVLFDFDKAALRPEAKAMIDMCVSSLKAYPKDIVIIEGHTSSEGSADYNKKLGLRRAEAVEKYMIESGIKLERIITKSLGEAQPEHSDYTPASRKLNRRVELIVKLRSDSPQPPYRR